MIVPPVFVKVPARVAVFTADPDAVGIPKITTFPVYSNVPEKVMPLADPEIVPFASIVRVAFVPLFMLRL